MSKARKLNQSSDNYIYNKALIYCRVSSDRQVVEGHGLDSQQMRCEKLARDNNLEVVKVFPDEGISGAIFDRPAMRSLIGYLDEKKTENFVIIFDDVSRFARDVKVHLFLRSELIARGAKLMCPNFNFEDSAEGEFAEIITAASAQYDRQKNKRRVIQRMQARLESGYWPFAAKKGFDIIKDPVHGKLSVPNEYGLKILAPTLEDFAQGVYAHKVDLVRALMEKGFWKTQTAEKYITKITAIIRDPFYAGYIEYPQWNVSIRKGHHKGIISLDTFELIQKRLDKVDLKKRVRIDTSPDFPLRGLIIHDRCKGHITGAPYSNGKGKVYLKYVCHTNGCEEYNKPFSANTVEDRFEEVLKRGALKVEADIVLKKMFSKVWEDELNKMKESQSYLEQQKRALEKKLTDLTDLLLAAKSPIMKKNYEKQIENTVIQVEQIEGKSIINLDMSIPYQTSLEKATTLLKSPHIAWKKLNVHEQHDLFFFLFQEKLEYSITEGYQTHKIPYTATLFEDFASETTHLVDLTGVAPATSGW